MFVIPRQKLVISWRQMLGLLASRNVKVSVPNRKAPGRLLGPITRISIRDTLMIAVVGSPFLAAASCRRRPGYELRDGAVRLRGLRWYRVSGSKPPSASASPGSARRRRWGPAGTARSRRPTPRIVSGSAQIALDGRHPWWKLRLASRASERANFRAAPGKWVRTWAPTVEARPLPGGR